MEKFYFRKVELHEKEWMEKIYQLRFQVYCHECHFLNAHDYPSGLEIDGYDQQSIHFAAVNEDGDVVGTMRMILPGKEIFPIEKHCPNIVIQKDAFPGIINFAEISRLVITKNMRRRKNDGMYYEPEIDDRKVTDDNHNEFLRRAKPMAFGLYRELYQESKRSGITHWYSLMEKSLWLLLRMHGFKFIPIGEEVDVYGPVRPYLGKVPEIEEEVFRKFPQFYEYFSENLPKKSY